MNEIVFFASFGSDFYSVTCFVSILRSLSMKINNSFMLPWMAMVAAMGANQMPTPTIQKKKKKKTRGAVAGTEALGSFAEQQAQQEPVATHSETETVVVANLQAEEEQIAVEKAFRLASHIALPFFAPIADFRRQWFKQYMRFFDHHGPWKSESALSHRII